MISDERIEEMRDGASNPEVTEAWLNECCDEIVALRAEVTEQTALAKHRQAVLDTSAKILGAFGCEELCDDGETGKEVVDVPASIEMLRDRCTKAEARAQALTEALHTLTELAAVNGAVNSGDITDLLANPNESVDRFFSVEEIEALNVDHLQHGINARDIVAALRAARGAR